MHETNDLQEMLLERHARNMTHEQKYALIMERRESPGPLNELDWRCEAYRRIDPAFRQLEADVSRYTSELSPWCKWEQMRARQHTPKPRPARPDGIPASFDDEMLAYYGL